MADVTSQQERETPNEELYWPEMMEDEGQEDMGDSLIHQLCLQILSGNLSWYFSGSGGHAVITNMNVHYHPTNLRLYVSPDVMVLPTPQPLPEDLTSYRVGSERPGPVVTIEVLSERTYQQGDLGDKVRIYANLGVREYILVDVTGAFLPERLLLRRLQDDRTWQDEQDEDGGVTSELGFRLVLDPADDNLRVGIAETGELYPRPGEVFQYAQVATQQAQAATQRADTLTNEVREVREENSQLREMITQLQARLQALEEERQPPANDEGSA